MNPSHMFLEMEEEIKKIIKPIITPEELIKKVGVIIRGENVGYIEAVMAVASDLDLEPEDIAKIINGPLKAKIEVEARMRNILPRLNTGSLYDIEDEAFA